MKVLVISHNSFSKSHNNGKTLSAIFSSFDPEELCQLFFTPNGTPDIERCSNYYLISDRQALKSIFKRRDCGGEPVISENSSNVKPSIARKQNDFLLWLRSCVWLLSSWYTGGLARWIVKQNPDIIFFVGGNSIFSHKIATKLSKKLNIPVVSYFTDDYILYPKNSIYRRMLKKQYKETISNSSLLFVIGEQMATEYTQNYRRKFYPIMNSVPQKEFIPNQINPQKIRISYFGGLHLNRWKMLVRLSKILPDNCILQVYTSSPFTDDMNYAFNNSSIIMKKFVTGNELDKALAESNILLHVESDEIEYRRLTRLSISTKIPEYLMAGRPLIAFGPKEVASIKFLKDNGLGISLDSDLSDNEIKNKLDSYFEKSDRLDEIGVKQYKYAIKNFDQLTIASNFKKKIFEVCSDISIIK